MLSVGIVEEQPASKASLFIGIRAILAREGRLAKVSSTAGPLAKALINHPPVASEWVSADAVQELLVAIAEHEGVESVQRTTRRAVTESIVPLLRSYAGPLLRLFGATPHSIFARLGDVMKLTNRGILGGYRRGGDKVAFVSFRHNTTTPLHPVTFQSWRGSLEAILDFCDVKGTVSPPVVFIASDGAEFELRWQ